MAGLDSPIILAECLMFIGCFMIIWGMNHKQDRWAIAIGGMIALVGIGIMLIHIKKRVHNPYVYLIINALFTILAIGTLLVSMRRDIKDEGPILLLGGSTVFLVAVSCNLSYFSDDINKAL